MIRSAAPLQDTKETTVLLRLAVPRSHFFFTPVSAPRERIRGRARRDRDAHQAAAQAEMADAASLSAPRRFASSTNSPLTEIRDPNTFAALVYTPPQAAEPLPLLLYLHGAGESGSRLWDIISEGATGTPPVELHFGQTPILSSN